MRSMLCWRGSDDVDFLVNHDTSIVLAQRSKFSLRLFKDPLGLRIEADLPQSDAGEAIAAIIESSKVQGFSFTVLDGTDFRTAGNATYIKQIQISEVSLVTDEVGAPAYPLVAPIVFCTQVTIPGPARRCSVHPPSRRVRFSMSVFKDGKSWNAAK